MYTIILAAPMNVSIDCIEVAIWYMLLIYAAISLQKLH